MPRGGNGHLKPVLSGTHQTTDDTLSMTMLPSETAPFGAVLTLRLQIDQSPFTTSTTRSTVKPKCGISASIGAEAP